MIKKYVGLDFLDLVIQFAVTMCLAVIASAVTRPDDEIGVAMVCTASLAVLAWRRSRAMKEQQRSAPITGEVQLDRLAYLEDRVAELEQGQQRVMELEERLDFTERMLAQQRDPARIGPGQ